MKLFCLCVWMDNDVMGNILPLGEQYISDHMWHFFPSRPWPVGSNTSPRHCCATYNSKLFLCKPEPYTYLTMYISHCFHHKICRRQFKSCVSSFQKAKRLEWKKIALNGIKVKGGKNTKQLEFSTSWLSPDSCCFSGTVHRHPLRACYTHTHTGFIYCKTCCKGLQWAIRLPNYTTQYNEMNHFTHSTSSINCILCSHESRTNMLSLSCQPLAPWNRIIAAALPQTDYFTGPLMGTFIKNTVKHSQFTVLCSASLSLVCRILR